MAGVYLVAFPVMVIGLVLTLITQWTGIDTVARGFGLAMFPVGGLTINAVSRLLQDRVPAQTGGFRKDRGRAWNRLVLGRELPAAWRVLKG